MLGVVLAGLLAGTAQAETVVFAPTTPTDKLVLYIHGSGGTARSMTTEGPRMEVTESLLAAGFAVAGADAGGNNWGSAQSVDEYEALIHSLPYTRIYLWAESMGGLDAMQLIGRLHPEAMVAQYPVCNARAIIPWIETYAEEVWDGQPPSYLSPVRPSDAEGLPVTIWSSPEDTAVPKRYNANVCAKELREDGASVEEVTTEGPHGDPSNFRPHMLTSFLRRQGPRPKASVLSR